MKIAMKELFKDALPLVEQFAPSIAGAIGGPVGMAAGYIIPIMAHAFNSSPTNISSIASSILSDPDASNKLSTIQSEHGAWIDGLMNDMNDLASAEINIKLNWQLEKNNCPQ